MPKTSSTTPRLRARPLPVPFHVVLVEPEIPPNTGNVAPPLRGHRVAAAPRRGPGLPDRASTASAEPASTTGTSSMCARTSTSSTFSMPGRRNRPTVTYTSSARSPREATSPARTPGATRSSSAKKASAAEDLLARFPDRVAGIPTLGAVRSLNLANAVGIVLYEGLRQAGALADTYTGWTLDTKTKRENWPPRTQRTPRGDWGRRRATRTVLVRRGDVP